MAELPESQAAQLAPNYPAVLLKQLAHSLRGADLIDTLKALGKHQLDFEEYLETLRSLPTRPPYELLAQISDSPLEFAANWLGLRTNIGTFTRDMWREIAIRLARRIGFEPSKSDARVFGDIQKLAPKVRACDKRGLSNDLKNALATKWPELAGALVEQFPNHGGSDDSPGPRVPAGGKHPEWVTRSKAANRLGIEPPAVTRFVKNKPEIAESPERGSRVDINALRTFIEEKNAQRLRDQGIRSRAEGRTIKDAQKAEEQLNDDSPPR